MIITHAKVSGVANPSDPDLVGGEDWDADHVVAGPVIVSAAVLRLTEGGAILSESSSGFTSAFSKTETGTYRAKYDRAAYGNVDPLVMASFSKDSGSPVAVRWTLEDNSTDYYIKVATIDSAGDPVNVSVSSGITVFGIALL